MATVPKRRAGKRAAKPAPEPEPEATEEEVLEDEEGGEEDAPTKKRDTTPLPSGEELYEAKYTEGMTWQEIRDNLDPRIRSPKGLALIAEYVIENGLEDEHPEFAAIDAEGEELAEAIVNAHDSGQGWAVLAARCGMKLGEVQDIYADAGGENPGRVGGQRYGGGRSTGKGAEEGEEGEEEATEEEAEEPAPKPASKRRAGSAKAKPKAKPAAAEPEAEAPAAKPKAPARRRRGAPTPFVGVLTPDNAADAMVGRVVHVMHKHSDHVVEAGVRDRPYEEKSYVVSGVRKVFPERGDRERSGPYGQGLIQFYTEGMKRGGSPFGHTVDIADIILIE